ncbi:hypothetical protein FQN60_009917, partial [Etheostoma spectabile]
GRPQVWPEASGLPGPYAPSPAAYVWAGSSGDGCHNCHTFHLAAGRLLLFFFPFLLLFILLRLTLLVLFVLLCVGGRVFLRVPGGGEVAVEFCAQAARWTHRSGLPLLTEVTLRVEKHKHKYQFQGITEGPRDREASSRNGLAEVLGAERKTVLVFLFLVRLLPQGGEDGEPAHLGIHHAIQTVCQSGEQSRILLFYLEDVRHSEDMGSLKVSQQHMETSYKPLEHPQGPFRCAKETLKPRQEPRFMISWNEKQKAVREERRGERMPSKGPSHCFLSLQLLMQRQKVTGSRRKGLRCVPTAALTLNNDEAPESYTT